MLRAPTCDNGHRIGHRCCRRASLIYEHTDVDRNRLMCITNTYHLYVLVIHKHKNYFWECSNLAINGTVSYLNLCLWFTKNITNRVTNHKKMPNLSQTVTNHNFFWSSSLARQSVANIHKHKHALSPTFVPMTSMLLLDCPRCWLLIAGLDLRAFSALTLAVGCL